MFLIGCLAWAMLLGDVLPVASAATGEGSAIEMFVGDQPVAAGPAGIELPATHKAVRFRLGKPAESAGDPSRRMRFKLEGIDSGWREISSEMAVMARFADAAGDQVGQQIFRVAGKSPGWNEKVESSTFSDRRETVRVPAGSTRITVALSSSGPPTAMGVHVARRLKILRATPNGPVAIFEAASSAIGPDGIPAGWRRSGTRPSMAQLLLLGSETSFGIFDDDPSAHAEWNLSQAAAPSVQPGELLTLEWAEMHDIGMGNRFDVNYGTLGAGAYRFLANALDSTGKPLAAVDKVEFVVRQPFWKSAWFWVGATVFGGASLWFGCRAIIRARIRQHLARVEQERLLERERLRIARDLHDDLGARLTHISLVSGLAENEPQSAAARESFQRISGMARELVAALYHTVWTVNPENDDLEALVNFLGQLAETLCQAAGIRCRIHACAVTRGLRVTSEVRHNVTLAVKEAVHNAIKHAGATEITAQTEFADSRLVIVIADNGRGFDPATVEAGCGLANMRKRMAMIGGSLVIERSPDAGTRVRFEVPLLAAESNAPAATGNS